MLLSSSSFSQIWKGVPLLFADGAHHWTAGLHLPLFSFPSMFVEGKSDFQTVYKLKYVLNWLMKWLNVGSSLLWLLFVPAWFASAAQEMAAFSRPSQTSSFSCNSLYSSVKILIILLSSLSLVTLILPTHSLPLTISLYPVLFAALDSHPHLFANSPPPTPPSPLLFRRVSSSCPTAPFFSHSLFGQKANLSCLNKWEVSEII